MTHKEQQHTDQSQNESSFSHAVLEKITQEQVKQTPRAYFLIAEYGMWLLWLLSVLIGAVAFSVIIFFATHAPLTLYEATHEGLLFLFLDIIPYAWVVIFVLVAILAHINLRHTKRGYKYEVWQILVSSIVASFLGGVILHMLGVGFLVDSFIAKRIPVLPALQTMEARMWLAPMQGRMLGIYQSDGEYTEGKVLQFLDEMGESWSVSVDAFTPEEMDLLTSGKKVRIVGVPSTTAEYSFIGCGVFRWNPEAYSSIGEMRAERDLFLKRMRLHHDAVRDKTSSSSSIVAVLAQHVCEDAPAVQRVQRRER